MVIRKVRSDKDKAKIGIRALRESETLREIAHRFGVTAGQVSKWRSLIESESYQLFSRQETHSRRDREYEEELKGLYEQIGRLKVENEFLKKKTES
jgi:transposase